MTITNPTRVVTATGNGATTIFPYTFLIPEASDLVVILYDTVTSIATTLDPSQYSATGLGDEAGGSVTYPLTGTPLSSTEKISILRTMPYEQGLDVDGENAYNPALLESQLDKIVMQIQQVAEEVGRAVTVPVGLGVTSEDYFQTLATFAATQIGLIDTAGSDAVTAIAADKAAADADAAAAHTSELNAASSAANAAASALSVAPLPDQINAATDTAFVDADMLTARKASDGSLIKRSWANIKAATFVALGPLIAATTAKTIPVDADGLLLADSAASGAGKLLTWANLRSNALKGLVIRKQVFTSSGTYTPNAHLIYAHIRALGGGGAGGGVTGTSGWTVCGGGGGAGSVSEKIASAATIGASQTVTIGAGGTGASAANGGNGSDSSVGALCLGGGGIGGKFNNLTSSFGGGGAGGVAGTGDITSTGATGGSGPAAIISTVNLVSGGGGSSPYGGGGAGYLASGSAAPGLPATLYGSGGSGAAVGSSATSAKGGDGSAGLVIITEYCSQ